MPEEVALVAVIGTLIPIVMFIGLFTFLIVAARASSRRKAQEAQARYDFLTKMTQGGSFDADKLIEFEREELKLKRRRRIENLNVWGLVLIAAGLGCTIFFYFVGMMEADVGGGLATLGLPPLFVGGALMLAALMMKRSPA
ncbi:MAG: hypothetical protein V3U98_10175 [Acidobacteriota bacterium]